MPRQGRPGAGTDAPEMARPRRSRSSSLLLTSGLLLAALLLLAAPPLTAAQADPPSHTQRKYKDIRNGDVPPPDPAAESAKAEATKKANWASNPQASKLAAGAASMVSCPHSWQPRWRLPCPAALLLPLSAAATAHPSRRRGSPDVSLSQWSLF